MEILRAANAEIAMRRILQAAVSEKASDVHLEPCREFVLVRFRIDGTLTERYRLPPDMAAGLSGQSPGRYGRGGKPYSPGRKFFGNQG